MQIGSKVQLNTAHSAQVLASLSDVVVWWNSNRKVSVMVFATAAPQMYKRANPQRQSHQRGTTTPPELLTTVQHYQNYQLQYNTTRIINYVKNI
jgi:hypothetical protein